MVISKMKYQSTKTFNGFSTAFRQWKANSHCKYLHGYSLSFKVKFEGKLDTKNWVMNFDGFDKIKKFLENTFENTTIVEKDDPHLSWFEKAHYDGIIQIIIMDGVGCEKFAEHIFGLLNYFVSKETDGRVKVIEVECFEDGTNSSAIYKEV